jgi:hypothetical protein
MKKEKINIMTESDKKVSMEELESIKLEFNKIKNELE